jgi:hypothetical protein
LLYVPPKHIIIINTPIFLLSRFGVHGWVASHCWLAAAGRETHFTAAAVLW